MLIAVIHAGSSFAALRRSITRMWATGYLSMHL